jgi:ubiquinone/menaquinone biosynthesis C-methylase UbiE
MSTPPNNALASPEAAVEQRYAAASKQVEPALCCPVNYDTRLLEVIPTEVLERDYGCGDPSRYVQAGETVLDLGSGGGKLAFIAAQVVGSQGRVIGVDCNLDMLQLARWAAPQVADRLGYANVDFRCGLIQDLQLDLERLEASLQQEPIRTIGGFLRSRQIQDQLRIQHPLVESNSVDCVVSNCVLNLVRLADRHSLFAEIFRVLRPGGRCVISDIVSDQSVPTDMQRDPELWSGCLSGAFREDQFLQAFSLAGFQNIQLAQRAAEPWQVVRGIEFRSVTVIAHKQPIGALPQPLTTCCDTRCC